MTNEIKPVVIPREVADAIESFRSTSVGNRRIIELAQDGGISPNANVLHAWASAGNFDTLLTALVNGYEREKTPEETVAEMYRQIRYAEKTANGIYNGDSARYTLAAVTIERVLTALGIEIPGVNIPEQTEVSA